MFVSILKAVDDNLIKGNLTNKSTSLLSSLVLRLSTVLRSSELLRLSFIYFSGGMSSHFNVSFFRVVIILEFVIFLFGVVFKFEVVFILKSSSKVGNKKWFKNLTELCYHIA